LEDVFAGTTSDWKLVRIDLSPYIGQKIMLRFRLWRDAPEQESKGAGWYVDDVMVYDMADCHVGAVTFMKDQYPCDGTINVVVRDLDLNTDTSAQEIVNIWIESTTEFIRESVTLTELDVNSWRFAGQIDSSKTDMPGIIQVSHGDLVIATYIDDDDGWGGIGIEKTDTAGIDCGSPLIKNVQAINITDTTADIIWETTEPADSLTCYFAIMFNCEYSSLQDISHMLHLTGLESCTEYSFYVESRDSAKNSIRDDNGGLFYTFKTKERFILFNDDMEEPRIRNWFHGPVWGSDNWERGRPWGEGYDPYYAHSGMAVWGTDLGDDDPTNSVDGLYSHGSSQYVRSPTINCTGYYNLEMQYWRWLTVEEGIYDNARIYVNGNMVWENEPFADHIDKRWIFQTVPLSPWADNNPAVKIKFELVSDGGKRFGGWNIDDVQVYKVQDCLVAPDTATPTYTPTPTSTPTSTNTPTSTPTNTPSFTLTATRTPTKIPTFTPVPTRTPTRTNTSSPTPTPSPKPTITPTKEMTPPPVIPTESNILLLLLLTCLTFLLRNNFRNLL